MATCNFWTMDDFYLMVKIYEPITEEYFKEDILSYDNDLNYDDFILADREMFYQDIIDNCDGFIDDMDDFNDSLIFYNIKLKSGYYDGLQLYIDEKSEYWEEDENKREKEIIKINEWLTNIAEGFYNWRKLKCIGVFSNGEAIYDYEKG